MRVLRNTGIVAAGFLVALSIPAGAAPARTLAPGYVSSEPEDGAMLDHPPEQVEVTFDEPLDPESTLRVEDECGRQIDDGDVTVQVNQMTVGIELTPSGDYTVKWLAKGIAGATGQDTGSFSFMVHHGPACDGGGGGGHDGHGGGGGGAGGGGGHEGHEGGGGGGDMDEHGGHESTAGTDHGSMDHSTSEMDHGAGRHADMDHGQMKHGQMKHGKKKNGKHANHKRPKAPTTPAENPPSADPGGDPPIAPNGAAVMLALGLSLALGGVGGWFLRVSGVR
ncbi:MAG TPA: copper resistance CopC family protein [Actinomycetota bacterium]|nr:copper resistance CopC family protein [Actinomycetota bacterium]